MMDFYNRREVRKIAFALYEGNYVRFSSEIDKIHDARYSLLYRLFCSSLRETRKYNKITPDSRIGLGWYSFECAYLFPKTVGKHGITSAREFAYLTVVAYMLWNDTTIRFPFDWNLYRICMQSLKRAGLVNMLECAYLAATKDMECRPQLDTWGIGSERSVFVVCYREFCNDNRELMSEEDMAAFICETLKDPTHYYPLEYNEQGWFSNDSIAHKMYEYLFSTYNLKEHG